jgi:hypothetical protein
VDAAQAPAAGHCDQPGGGPDGTGLSRAAHKRAVAAEIVAAAEIVGSWEHDEITRDEAAAMISTWMN